MFKIFNKNNYLAVLWGVGAALTVYAAYPGKPIRILALPEVRAQYLAAGLNAAGSSLAAFGAYIETEREKRVKVVKAGGMGAE